MAILGNVLGSIFSGIVGGAVKGVLSGSKSSSSSSSGSSSSKSSSSKPTYGQDVGGYYKIGTDGKKVYQTSANKQYFPNDYGGTAGWNYGTSPNDYYQDPYATQKYSQNPQYQPIDNSALYEQQARERQAQIRAAIDRQRTAAQGNISSIENQYGTAIGNIEAQRSKLPGEFQTLANQASNRGQVNTQRIRNAMAQMGLGQSGESASQQLQQNLATSQQLNDLNLNRQNIEADMGRQVSTLQGEQAAKIAQINQAIADAEAAGDEQAALALEEARAKITAEANQNAVLQNQWNVDMTDRIRAAQAAAEQNAWDRGGFDSAYDKLKAEQELRQAQQLGLLDYEYAKRGELAKLEAALRSASSYSSSGNGSSGGNSGGSGGYTPTTAVKNAKPALSDLKNRGYGMQSAIEFARANILPSISGADTVAKNKAWDDIMNYIHQLYDYGSTTGMYVGSGGLTSPGEY